MHRPLLLGALLLLGCPSGPGDDDAGQAFDASVGGGAATGGGSSGRDAGSTGGGGGNTRDSGVGGGVDAGESITLGPPVEWSTSLQGQLLGALDTGDALMLVGQGSASLVRISAKDGSPVWSLPVPGFVEVQDVSRSDRLLVLGGTTGTSRFAWVVGPDGGIEEEPAIALEQAERWRFDRSDRIYSREKWVSRGASGSFELPLNVRSFDVEDRLLYVEQVLTDVTLAARTLDGGTTLWSRAFQAPNSQMSVLRLQAGGGFTLTVESTAPDAGLDFGCGPTGANAVSLFDPAGHCVRSVALPPPGFVSFSAQVPPDGAFVAKPAGQARWQLVLEQPDGGSLVFAPDAGPAQPQLAASRRTGALYFYDVSSQTLHRVR